MILKKCWVIPKSDIMTNKKIIENVIYSYIQVIVLLIANDNINSGNFLQ
jgi:hypothetical protein